MAIEPVNERPIFPSLGRADSAGVGTWSVSMIRQLTTVFQQYGFRLNNALLVDGGEAMENPLILATFTTSTLPTASEWEGAIIYVSDGAVGEKFRGSNGTDWVNLG